MNRRSRFAAAITAGLCVVLAGCGIFGGKTAKRQCPPVLLLDHARDLTKFRDGPGRDITDIEFRARIVNFTGGCDYDGDEVTVNLGVDILVERGTADVADKAAFTYFVAIPVFFPNAAGKRVFEAKAAFEDRQRRTVFHDDLRLKIPIARGTPPNTASIYVGLQLSEEQLRYNRARTVR